jgi:hypothetical protein
VCVVTAADAFPALEAVRGTVRRNTELGCPLTCDSYYLEPDTGFAFIFLNGMDIPDYLGEHVDVFGTRGLCGICHVFNVVEVSAVPVGVEDASPVLPSLIALKQNYPNPFNPATTIEFSLDAMTEVSLSVIDLLGRTVEVLASGNLPPGVHRRVFDASGMSSGVYRYVLRTPERTLVKAMLILR